MKFKWIVGICILGFGSSVGYVMYMGFVVNPPPPGLALPPAPVASAAPIAASPTPTVVAAAPTPTVAAATPPPAPVATPRPVRTGGGVVAPPPVRTVVTPPPATPPPTPPPTPCGSAGGACTSSQVAAHNSPSDCWVIYGGNYYLVTSYIQVHPGTAASFTSQTCGHDITAYMNGSASVNGQSPHVHSAYSYTVLKSYYVGPVRG